MFEPDGPSHRLTPSKLNARAYASHLHGVFDKATCKGSSRSTSSSALDSGVELEGTCVALGLLGGHARARALPSD
jgi:hypothetical protein